MKTVQLLAILLLGAMVMVNGKCYSNHLAVSTSSLPRYTAMHV